MPYKVIPNFLGRWIKGYPLCLADLSESLLTFDIVHAYSLGILPAVLRHPRLVWTVHGPWEKAVGQRARRIAMAAKKVIAVSEDVRRHCKFPEKLLMTIPLGSLSEQKIKKIEKDCHLAECSEIKIGVLGRFQRIKGQDIAIEAVFEVAKKNPGKNFLLSLSGALNTSNKADVTYYQEIKNLKKYKSNILKNLRINLEGHTDTPLSFIDMQHLMLVPSRYESFSMVTVESLARGIPVIVPNIGGPAEIVNSNAIGLKFIAGDCLDAANAILSAINGRGFSSHAIYDRAVEFSIERQANRHLELYKSFSV